MTKQAKTTAVIVAAGESRRMNGQDKIFADLAGKPVLAHAIAAFEGCGAVDEIIVVVSKGNVARCRKLVAAEGYAKVAGIVAGGVRRQDSVKAGLDKLEDCQWVIVHDGARPLVTAELVLKGLEAGRETGAAAAAVPVTDTIKLAGDDNIVQETLERGSLWAVQTPQIFRYDIIARAYQQITADVTDDAALAEQIGYWVKLYAGNYANIKITNPDDLTLAEVLLKKHGG